MILSGRPPSTMAVWRPGSGAWGPGGCVAHLGEYQPLPLRGSRAGRYCTCLPSLVIMLATQGVAPTYAVMPPAFPPPYCLVTHNLLASQS
jgi:hypothetical protein